MTLLIDASSPAAVKATGSAVNTSASFTPPAGRYLALITTNATFARDASVTSVAGGGLTWTKRAWKSLDAGSTGGAGQAGTSAEIWEAYAATSPGAMTVTVTPNTAATGTWELVVKVMVFTGDEGATYTGAVAAASNAAGQPSVALSAASGSYVLASAGDWSTAGAVTPASGQTIIDDQTDSQYSSHLWRTTSPTGTSGTVTMGCTAGAAQNYNAVALEIKAGASSTPVSETTDPAALAWAGTTATLKTGIAAAGKAAAAAWSGTAAATKVGVVSTLAVAALAWTGTQASIVTGVHQPTDPAATAWAGTNATTKIGVAEQADPAALAWTGVAPSLNIATVLDVGGIPSLAWAGTNTTLTGAGIPPTDEPVGPAAAAWAGTETALKVGVNARANPAGLAWAGTQARTRVDTVAAGNPAGLAWSGTNTRTSVGSTTGTQPAAAAWAGTVATIRATADLAIPGNPAGLAWAGTNATITGAVPNRTRNITITISLITGGWSAAPASGGWSMDTAPISGWGTDTPNGGWAADSITA